MDDRTAFRTAVRHVTAHYERYLPVLETEGVWKVLVECLAVGDEGAAPHNEFGVAVVQSTFPFAEFASGSIRVRNELALRTAHTGALRVARYYGWPEAPFETARAGVIGDDFHNVWVWKSKRHAKSRRNGELRCEHEHDAFRAWLVIKDAVGRALAEKQVIQEQPSERSFVPLLGKLDWVSDQAVALISKAGEEVGRLELDAPGADHSAT
jgi:hypothetical protein